MATVELIVSTVFGDIVQNQTPSYVLLLASRFSSSMTL